MQKGNSIWGILLIAIGTVILLGRYIEIDLLFIFKFWPLIFLLCGSIFEISYFKNRNNPGILVPGGILIFLGILFSFEVLTKWNYANYTWPIYLLAVAFGLFQLYWFDRRDPGLLIPIGILSIIAISSYSTLLLGKSIFYILRFRWLFPVALILIGIWILYKNKK